MEQNPSWKANSHSASQEISCLLWNRVHKSSSLVPVLSQLHAVQNFSPCFSNMYSHLHLGLLSGLFPAGFPTKVLYQFIISPMDAV